MDLEIVEIVETHETRETINLSESKEEEAVQVEEDVVVTITTTKEKPDAGVGMMETGNGDVIEAEPSPKVFLEAPIDFVQDVSEGVGEQEITQAIETKEEKEQVEEQGVILPSGAVEEDVDGEEEERDEVMQANESMVVQDGQIEDVDVHVAVKVTAEEQRDSDVQALPDEEEPIEITIQVRRKSFPNAVPI